MSCTVGGGAALVVVAAAAGGREAEGRADGAAARRRSGSVPVHAPAVVIEQFEPQQHAPAVSGQGPLLTTRVRSRAVLPAPRVEPGTDPPAVPPASSKPTV